jgi:HTH-type transcriptional regulator/antitoxin HigA
MTTTKINLKDLTPAYLIHPGEILQDELDARGISQASFAQTIGVQKTQLNEILKGKRNFTTELCLLAASALQMSDHTWLNMLRKYEEDKAKIKVRDQLEAIEFEHWTAENTNAQFLKKLGFITEKPEESIQNVRNLYDLAFLSKNNSVVNEPSYAMYRKSQKLASDPINIITWEKVVMHRANKKDVVAFDANSAEELIPKLRAVFKENVDVLRQSVTLLAEYGIKLIIQETPEKCNVDGVSFWSGDNPAIGLPLRYKQLDIFAFTLLHELGHVYLHLINDEDAQFTDILQDDHTYGHNREETEANDFARNHLIAKDAWKDFQMRYFTPLDADFIAFSGEQNIHPSIAFGRFCFEMKKWGKKTKIDRSIG